MQLVYIQFVLNSVQALPSRAQTDCELAITTNSSIPSRFNLALQRLSLLFFIEVVPASDISWDIGYPE